MLIVTLFAPEGTVTLAGSVKSAGLLLDRVTTAPAEGAGPFSETVSEAAVPPTTLA